jgi:uncharacterized membrane protein YfcA
MYFEAVFLGSALVAAFASGLAGFAMALIALSLWLHVMPPSQAVPCVLAASLVSQTMGLWRLRGALRLDLLWPFAIGGVLGVPLGALAVAGGDPWLLRKAIGLFLLLYSLFMLVQPPLPAIVRGGRIGDGVVGMISGAMGGAAGLSGAIMPIWCDLRGWRKDEQRAIFQPFIIVTQLAALAFLGGIGTLDGETLRLIALELPVIVLGVWAGLAVYARIDAAQFRRVLMCLLLVSGVILLV